MSDKAIERIKESAKRNKPARLLYYTLGEAKTQGDAEDAALPPLQGDCKLDISARAGLLTGAAVGQTGRGQETAASGVFG